MGGGGVIEGIPVLSPIQILQHDYDIIIIGSMHGAEIKNQLINDLGIDKQIIWDIYHGPSYDGRIATLRSCAIEIERKNMQGSIAELGVYQGDFSWHMNSLMKDRKLYLFDTFEGFYERDIMFEQSTRDGAIEGVGQDEFIDTSVLSVLNKMPHKEQCSIYKGYFPDSLQGLEDIFCLVSIDADLYLPIMNGLEYFYPRMVTGGYILVHDVDGLLYPGAKSAVNDFCDKNNLGVVHLNDRGGTVVIVKQ